MAEQKAALFPSLGRARVVTPRTSSETIAHPLLGAGAPPSTDDSDRESAMSVPVSVSRSPELPYKPRQRPASAAPPEPTISSSPGSAPPVTVTSTVSAPTSSSATFASSSTSSSAALAGLPDEPATATSRLQLQSLKAAAQRIGLGNGSQGMSMIDAIFDKGARVRTEAGDWADLLKVLTSGKAIILLPSSPASSLPMTPQTLRDHIAFVAPPIPVSGSSTASVVVTLSGLIGTLRGTTVAFESTIPPDSPLVCALRDDARRVGVLSSLRPTQIDSRTSFPSYTLSEESASLSFPPLGRSAPLPSDKKEKEVPRRMMPFMSLFGGAAAPPPPKGTASPERPLSPSPGGGSKQSSPRPSIVSLDRVDSNTSDSVDGYAVTAYTISTPVRFTEVHKALVKAVRSSVRSELEGLPDRIADKVLRLVVPSVCPVSGSGLEQVLLKSHHQVPGSVDSDGVPLDFADPTACGERLQDFMEAVYDDLVRFQRDSSPSTKRRSDSHEKEDESDRIERVAGEGTERVEALTCRLLIFSPLQSDDARHDEALASRIAALNLLDLSLDHLGLITRPPNEVEKGAVAGGLAALVDDIGRELQKLSTYSCLTPRDKADVLVHAHKLAVEGLAKLPPIELRPEGEPYVPEKEEPLEAIVEQSDSGSERRVGSVPNLVLSDTSNTDSPLATSPVDTVGTADTARPAEAAPDESSDAQPAPRPDSPPAPASQVASEAAPTSQEAEALPASAPTAPAPPKSQPATSGADLILPLIIFAVVKANPPQLASQLMYLQRYRSAICLAGEASYAIVNLTAVVEFIEHVQLSALGLGDDSQVMSVEDLSPIRLTYLDESAETASIVSASSRLRGRVFQVGELAGSAAGSANKVITGVVDSLSSLRGYISPAEDKLPAPAHTRPRGASAFSLASVTASVANMAAAATAARTRSRASSQGEWGERELVEVPVGSRPASLKPSTYSDGEESDHDNDHDPNDHGEPSPPSHDARSIRSVSSMMRESSRDTAAAAGAGAGAAVPGIGGRLAQMGFKNTSVGGGASTPPAEKDKGFFGFARGPVRRSSALGLGGMGMGRSPSGDVALANAPGGGGGAGAGAGLAATAGTASGPTDRGTPGSVAASLTPVAEPIERFMTCEAGDIRLSEVGLLLRDYRRLAGALARLQQ